MQFPWPTHPTVPVLAKSKTATGRLWGYVRDDRPFGGPAPPAAIFFYSRDRGGEHPCRHLAGYTGILQADAYAGFNDLYLAGRKPGPILEAACWAHGRRKLFVLADLAKAPLAVEAVRRIDVNRRAKGPPYRRPIGSLVLRCWKGGIGRAETELWVSGPPERPATSLAEAGHLSTAVASGAGALRVKRGS